MTTAAAAEPAVSDPVPAALPVTGASLASMAGIGIGFLLAGGAALLAPRAARAARTANAARTARAASKRKARR
jgi:hypothetical protein